MPKGYSKHNQGGWRHTKEAKKKISIIHKGKKLSNETKKKLGKAHKQWHKTHTHPMQGKHPEYMQGKNNHMYGRTGEKNPRWNGGKLTDKDGYILIRKINHPFTRKDGYVLRSRLVMEKKLGRYLTAEEIVHHKGTRYPLGSIENKQDDRIENLQLFANNSKHIKFHHFLKLTVPRRHTCII